MSAVSEKASSAVEDYVKAIYVLGERQVEVTTTALARHLQISPSSVSAMMSKLGSMDLVCHRPYGEISLTLPGLSLAMAVIRRRRLIELSLVIWLGYGLDEVEAEAEVLEHAVSEVFVERLSAKLGDPNVDPHGDPIPTRNGEIQVAPSRLLASLEPGSTGTLVRIWNGDPDALRYLASCNVGLGDRVEVLGRESFGGSVVVRVGHSNEGQIHGLGHGLAEMLSIRLDS